jgi:hypothetical protein
MVGISIIYDHAPFQWQQRQKEFIAVGCEPFGIEVHVYFKSKTENSFRSYCSSQLQECHD